MSGIKSTEDYLVFYYKEIDPMSFYRDLFPSGELDRRGAYSKDKYTGVALQLKDNGEPKIRLSITDDLGAIKTLINRDFFTVISPLSYCGKRQDSSSQRYCYAIAVDLDNLIVDKGYPYGIDSLFSQIKLAEDGLTKLIPRPTYIACSSPNNIHLYYLLDKPIRLWKKNKQALSKHKEALTKALWNQYVTYDYQKPQQEAIGQGMRAVGSIRKDKSGRVRAFLIGDKVSVDYLNSFNYAKSAQLIAWDSPDSSKNKGISFRPTKGNTSPYVYSWYKRKILEYAVEGKRYYQLFVLAVFGLKCNIPYEKVREDAISLVPILERLTIRPNNHFTTRDALAACKAYEKSHFILLRRETLVRLSGVPMVGSKRNYLPQAVHLQLARERKATLNRLGRGHAKNAGRPPIIPDVIDYLKSNPTAKPKEVAQAIGCSRSTVYNALKVIQDRP